MKFNMGIKGKILTGFIALGMLLFFSGVISFFQLNKLSYSSHSMLEASFKNTELAKKLLDAVQEQNTALLQMIVSQERNRDSLLLDGRAKFDSAFNQAQITVRDLQGFDSIYRANLAYNYTINEFLKDSLSQNKVNWYATVYQDSYANLTASIKNVMISTQRIMDTKAVRLEDSAYRATMPGLIALLIAIIIVMIFFYFVNLYYITPVLKISDALQAFLDSRVPFKVNIEGKDEVFRLKEQIEKLTGEIKSKRNE